MTLEGRATAAAGDLVDLLDELALPAPPAGRELPSQALAEPRAEER